MDQLGAREGRLVILDRESDKPRAEKIYWKTVDLPQGAGGSDLQRPGEESERKAFIVLCLNAAKGMVIKMKLGFNDLILTKEQREAVLEAKKRLNSFHREYVRTGKVDKSFGKLYDELFHARHQGDYMPMVTFDEKVIRQQLQDVEKFISEFSGKIKQTLERS